MKPQPTSHQDMSINRQRWRSFLAHRRGAWSLRILLALYAVSLFSELICNDRPLILRHRGRTFYPVFRSYTQDQVLGNGIQTRMGNYRAMLHAEAESRGTTDEESVGEEANEKSWWALWPLVASSPADTLRPDQLAGYRRMSIKARPIAPAANLQVNGDGIVLWTEGDVGHFFGEGATTESLIGRKIADEWLLPDALRAAIKARLDNRPAKAFDALCANAKEPTRELRVRLAPFRPRSEAPSSVRVLLLNSKLSKSRSVELAPDKAITEVGRWLETDDEGRAGIIAKAAAAREGEAETLVVAWDGGEARVEVAMEDIAWPFRPVPGHWLGIDHAGRDVFARLLYGLRTSMTFGLLLVLASMFFGILAGSIQGYFAGWLDITGQRLTEIWSALPFLYVMILLGNSLGRSFALLLGCYAAFNWIGVSTYIRAEYLRLRVRPFVDAARSQGLSSGRIMLRHVLPNALTPLITLLPFELVGAIGSLAALDYLGFGLPDGTPSWGDMLHQAQQIRSAWWLILYPSLALFSVMILGVFVGEGLREAFDPKAYSRLE